MASLFPISGMAATKPRGSSMDTSEPDTIQDAETTIPIQTRLRRILSSKEVKTLQEASRTKLVGNYLDVL